MAYEYQNFASLGVNLNRQAYGALDISAVFKTEADLTWYMTYGKESSKPTAWSKVEAPYPYEGQIVSLVSDTGVVTVYVLEAEKNEGGEIQSYDDGKVKLVKKTLSIAESAVSSVNGLTGAISIIPEPNSIIKVEKDSNNIKIGADTTGLIKANENNIVESLSILSSNSGSGEITVDSCYINILSDVPGRNISFIQFGSGEQQCGILMRSCRNLENEIVNSSSLNITDKIIQLTAGSGEILLNDLDAIKFINFETEYKFDPNDSGESIKYIATKDYVDDKIGNISSNKITSPDGNSFVEVTNENGLKIKNKNYDLTVPQKSGIIALTTDLPKQATTTELGIIKISNSLSDATDSVPTTSTVNTAVANLTTAINNLKSEVAGGVIYKGGVTASISENNITLAGASIPIKTGYMYSITSGSIVVDGITYTVGDYIIYKGATESQTEVVSKDNLTFINAQDSDVAKLGTDNVFTGANTFNDVINISSVGCIDPSINQLSIYADEHLSFYYSNGSDFYGSGEFRVYTYGNVAIYANDIYNEEPSKIIFNKVPVVSIASEEKTLATTDQLPKLPEGTKQLPTDGTWTMTQVVTLLNQIAAALGAPVYTA